MKRKLFALLLALALMLALFAGCGKTETPAQTPAETPAEAPAEEAPAEAPAEEPAQAPAEEPAAAPEEATAEDGTFVSPGGIAYPLSDGSREVSYWASFGGFWVEYLESFDDMLLLPYITDLTGVKYRFIEVSESAATEQFSLMVASGD